ncbi:hypothetical protein NON00_19820 [Roseomonas sp. GC11]|uniref:hypothetical protein n=1 Tax=Roseomonas sp. GC11 TaxID=2950546 RepID=UPI00210B44DC|nr:hypothetical protein [Roseomonas sp. GC11]MCQ4162162.1 hypothetical protein [Roseomonas sp. GC11]
MLDFNDVMAPMPPQRALTVGVGLGKTTAMHRHMRRLLDDPRFSGRKVVIGVPRHDLAEEQCHALTTLGLRVMVWKGRSAPDPTPETPDRRMCLDLEAPFDALAVERVVEQTACKVVRRGKLHACPFLHQCGYQAQKLRAAQAQIILTAHDTLFHEAPAVIGAVGLLVLDEGFWAAGLRGTDGKACLTLDGLRVRGSTVQCYDAHNQPHWDNTADLAAARGLLQRVLDSAPNGPLPIAALAATGLTPPQCRRAAGLEHRRLRNPGLLPGMDATERARRIAGVLPEPGAPWAPPGRAAAMWHLIAEALEAQHDVAGAVLCDMLTEHGTVQALRLAWRMPVCEGWGGDGPILHLDATMRPELVRCFLPSTSFAAPLMAVEPHVTLRQILGAPTTAHSLTPAREALQREQEAAARHLRQLATLIALRAASLRGRNPSGPDLLVVGQKGALDALRQSGLPANVEAVHFNALSGLDRWRDVAGLMILGRTLPAPASVEALAAALTNTPPLASRGTVSWWYEGVERRIALADGGVHPVRGEAHADPMAEALRWTICEGELIQALGRGRGVNRTAETPLEIDLLTDVVLPVTVHAVLAWEDVRPSRHDMMAAAGVELENAADMARCFPDLWETPDAVRAQKARSVTFCYYRDISNSRTSHSSTVVRYRPAGAGQKERAAKFDLALIPDPRAWLEARIGALAYFELIGDAEPVLSSLAPERVGEPLASLSARLEAAIQQRLASVRARLARLSAGLDARKPDTAAA